MVKSKHFKGEKNLYQTLWLLPHYSNASGISKGEARTTSWAHPEQPQLFLHCNHFPSTLTTLVPDKHLKLQNKCQLFNVSGYTAQHPELYDSIFLKMTFQGDKKSTTRSFPRSSSNRHLFFLGSLWQTNYIIFIPLKVVLAFIFQEIYINFC